MPNTFHVCQSKGMQSPTVSLKIGHSQSRKACPLTAWGKMALNLGGEVVVSLKGSNTPLSGSDL